MSVKYAVSLLAAALIGFTITPSYSTELVSCNGFESCPTSDGDAIVALTARVAVLEALLADVSRVTDSETSQDTLRFTGMNVQIVHGLGIDYPITGDGTGNLIIGRNRARRTVCSSPPEEFDCDKRGGSHNLIVGDYNNYTSIGGIVVGYGNEISEEYASVSGGYLNKASGENSSVSGGAHNKASGDFSSASGGNSNIASGMWSSVGGGENNKATGEKSSVSGGIANIASGTWSSVSGGGSKNAAGQLCWEGAIDLFENC